jgi:hypothetical protein
MEKMLSPKVPFVWSACHDAEFNDVKRAIMEAGMLFTVNYDYPLVIRTDASTVGVGAVLFQPVDGVEKPIAFASQKFSGGATTKTIWGGSEFGSNKYKQFPVWSGREGRGSKGWFIYPTLRRIQPEIVARWTESFTKVLKEWG